MRTRWGLTTLLILAAAVALVIVLRTESAGLRRVPDFGADMGVLFQSRLSPSVVTRALASAEGAGLGLARVAALWELTEPAPPRAGHHRYDWRYDDHIARQLAAHGFRWVAILAFAPGWASVDPTILHGAPRGTTDYAAYAAAVARRYRGLITAFEVWNEENTRAFWRPQPSAAGYARLYAAARSAIHRVDPGVPVLLGGLAGGHSRFLLSLLQQPELRGRIDGVAIHAYAATPAGVRAQVVHYRGVLDRQGFGTVPLYVTEYGWSSRRILQRQVPPGSYVPGSQRPGFIAQAARDVLDSGCDVRMAIFYAWVTLERDPGSLYQWFGVATPAGSATPSSRALAGEAQSLPGHPALGAGSCTARG